MLLPQHYNRVFPASKVLLIPHVLVGRQKELEASLFGCRQQVTVLSLVPTLLRSRAYGVILEIRADRYGRPLIE